MAPKNTSLTRHNGAAIRSFREQAGMKIPAFAALVGCSARHMHYVEKEQCGCSPELLGRIAKALGVLPGALLRFDDDRIAS